MVNQVFVFGGVAFSAFAAATGGWANGEGECSVPCLLFGAVFSLLTALVCKAHSLFVPEHPSYLVGYYWLGYSAYGFLLIPLFADGKMDSFPHAGVGALFAALAAGFGWLEYYVWSKSC